MVSYFGHSLNAIFKKPEVSFSFIIILICQGVGLGLFVFLLSMLIECEVLPTRTRALCSSRTICSCVGLSSTWVKSAQRYVRGLVTSNSCSWFNSIVEKHLLCIHTVSSRPIWFISMPSCSFLLKSSACAVVKHMAVGAEGSCCCTLQGHISPLGHDAPAGSLVVDSLWVWPLWL